MSFSGSCVTFYRSSFTNPIISSLWNKELGKVFTSNIRIFTLKDANVVASQSDLEILAACGEVHIMVNLVWCKIAVFDCGSSFLYLSSSSFVFSNLVFNICNRSRHFCVIMPILIYFMQRFQLFE